MEPISSVKLKAMKIDGVQFPEQFGIILDYDESTVMVQLFDEFYNEKEEDGLREVTWDQIDL